MKRKPLTPAEIEIWQELDPEGLAIAIVKRIVDVHPKYNDLIQPIVDGYLYRNAKKS